MKWATLRLAAMAAVTAVSSQSAMAQPVDLSDTWKFTVGAGVVSRAKYPGASDTRVSALPILGVSYGRFVFGSIPSAGAGLGVAAYLVQSERWRAGVGVGAGLGSLRKESDSATLKGMGDIKASTSASAFGSYNEAGVAVKAAVITDIGGKHQGTHATLDLEGKYRVNDPLMLTAGPGVTWGNATYTQTLFGVDGTQSATSGRAIYSTKSGASSARFMMAANYRITPQWSLGARVVAETLQGSAAYSPLTQKKSQTTVGLFTNYRF